LSTFAALFMLVLKGSFYTSDGRIHQGRYAQRSDSHCEEIESRHRKVVPGGNMKKLGVSTVLAVSALCFLPGLSPLKAHADTVSLTLENVGPGNNSGGVYTYPYNFSVDGSSSYTGLMCFDYTDEIYFGETWTATVVEINSSSSKEDLELAYLFSVASNPSTPADTVADAQWAAWELFDPGLIAPTQNGVTQTGVASELTNAQDADLANFYSGYALYIPESGWPANDGLPQSLIGLAPTPEPGSLVLLGTGLGMLAFAGAFYRRKRIAIY
jgi:hypothetical protein